MQKIVLSMASIHSQKPLLIDGAPLGLEVASRSNGQPLISVS
jgi:hypothetical protein